MVTWELAEHRSELERVLSLPELPPDYLPRETLQRHLGAVLAEQAERERNREDKLWSASA